jgi:hypothetical protein
MEWLRNSNVKHVPSSGGMNVWRLQPCYKANKWATRMNKKSIRWKLQISYHHRSRSRQAQNNTVSLSLGYAHGHTSKTSPTTTTTEPTVANVVADQGKHNHEWLVRLRVTSKAILHSGVHRAWARTVHSNVLKVAEIATVHSEQNLCDVSRKGSKSS